MCGFIRIDEKEYREIEVDVTDIFSKEELIEYINKMEVPQNCYIKIKLVGNCNMEINTFEIIKYIENPNIIKLKESCSPAFDIKSIAMQNNLKGIFVRKLLEKINEEPENREKFEKAIQIGINAFER